MNALHPGTVQTNLYANIPQPVRFIFVNIVAPLLFRVRHIEFLFVIFLQIFALPNRLTTSYL